MHGVFLREEVDVDDVVEEGIKHRGTEKAECTEFLETEI